MSPTASQAPVVVVVGAGPAGIRAAETLVSAGVRPIVLDENPAAGGQIYRQPPQSKRRSPQALYGFEWRKARGVHAAMERLAAVIDYRPGTLVWNCRGDALDTYHPARGHESIRFDRLIIATGAVERIAPIPGWETAGVYTVGAAQIALKAQASLLGDRPVFAGSGPLLYLVAYQYAKAGAQVAGVIDTTSLRRKVAALPALATRPATMLKGLYYLLWLRARGVRVVHGAQLLDIEGSAGVLHLRWREGGREQQVEGCIVCIGHGLRSETQLADLAGCEFAFSTVDRQWLPRRGPQGRSSNPRVYLAGDGAGILGADAAERDGYEAARAVLADIGGSGVRGPEAATDVDAGRGAFLRFRQGLQAAFAWPEDWARACQDNTIVCRCEGVSAGEIRAAVRSLGVTDINRVKAITRCGMGRCQGRICAAAATEVTAYAAGLPLPEVGRLRTQPPIKPIPFHSGAERPS